MRKQLQTFRKQLSKALGIGLLATLLGNSNASAQALTGTKTIPGDYSTITAAVNDLNTNGVGTGGVIFNIAPGYTETITATISLTATGTFTDPIVFQKSSAGTNPLITAYVGTNTPSSAAQDGIWRLVGSDYVTIDGIDLVDPNTTNPATMEYGYALYKSSLSNGAQNNTIKNCTITLSTVNNASGAGPSVDGSRGIDIVNATATAAATNLVPTARVGTNSYNKIYANTIKNCNIGISIIGYAASSPFLAADTLNDIGGQSLANGNHILNFGGASSAANAAAGIRTLAQYGINVSYNTVNNNDGAGVNHPNTLRGIYLNTATSASGNCNHNTVKIQGGGTTSTIYAIDVEFGSTAASNTVNINNNTIENCSYLTATTGGFYCIYSASTPLNLNIKNNLIQNNTINASTGSFYGINWSSPTNLYVDNNTVSGLSRTGAGTTYGINSSSSSVNEYVTNNIVHDLTITPTGTTSSTIYGIFSNTASGIKEFKRNRIYNLSITGGTATANTIHSLRVGYGLTVDISANTISGTSGNGNTITGISAPGTTTSAVHSIYNNKVYDLSSSVTSAPSITGILGSAQSFKIYNNLISDLRAPASSGTDVIRGIGFTSTTASSTLAVYYNSIYLNATSTGTNFGTTGIYHTVNATATTATLDLRNNLIVNTSASAGTGFTVAYRRSGTALSNYAATSNGNLFYAGTPGTANLIFYDGTNSDQTLATFKTRMGTRDILSCTEAPTFLSTDGSNADFLKISTTIATQIESGGTNIATYTKDFIDSTRAGNPGYPTQLNGGGLAPDIGAWEFDGILAAPTISIPAITPAGFQCVASPHTVTAEVVANQGSLSSVMLNYSFDGVAQTAITMINTGGNTYGGTIPVSTPDNAVVTYSITATNTLPLSKTVIGASYSDVPTPPSAVYAFPVNETVCAGRQATLRAVVATPKAGIIGNGSLQTTGSDLYTTTYTSPFDHYFGGTKTQYLIKASELTASGLIAGGILALSLDVVAPGGTYNTFAVNLANTSLNAMTTTLINSGLVQVYSAPSVTPTAGINTYNFTSPFFWDGTSNIVVQFCWSNFNAGGTATEVRYDLPGFVCESYYRADNSPAVNLCPQATATGTTSNRPRMILKGNTPATGYSWSDGSSIIGTTNPLPTTPVTNTTYTVTITDPYGCAVTSPVPASIVVSSTTLTGTVQVGTGYLYTTLTSAIEAYNSVCNIAGPLVFELTDPTYGPNETFPIVINNNPSASAINTLTIKPAPGNTVSITGKNPVSLLQLKGADYVTIDGSNDGSESRDLTFTNDTSAALTVVYISSNGLTDGATNITIKNCNIKGFSTSTSVAGIASGSAAGVGVGAESPMKNITIQNNVFTKVQNGMYLLGGATTLDSNVTVMSNTYGSKTNAADKLGFRGMFIGNSQNLTVSRNNILGVASTGASTTVGIQIWGPIDSAIISKNIITDVKNAGAYAVIGLYLGSTSTNAKLYVRNNSISNIAGLGSTTLDNNAAGIVIATGGGYTVQFNSVNMVSPQTTGSTSAIYVTAGITGANSINLQNNSFANNSTANHTRYAIYSAASNTVYTNINYNNYYSTGTNLGYLGGDVASLTNWKTATGKDQNSINVNPIYASVSNLIPDLGSALLHSGTSISNVTTDIVDSLRLDPPSIGAFEYGIDLTGPTITLTSLTNTTSTSNIALSNVTITDFSGVNTMPGTKPRVYYKKRSEANIFGEYPADNIASFNGWKYQEASNSASPFSFTIDYSLLTTTVSLTDTIQYFVAAQDLSLNNNVGSNTPLGFAATNIDSIITAPTTPLQYIIVDLPMSGPYTVGTSGDFPTLSAASTAMQLRRIQGDIAFSIISDITEPNAAIFVPVEEIGSGGYHVTIKPSIPVTVSGNAAANGLIVLSGADRITIDGRITGTGNNLTITNTNTAANSYAILVTSLGTGAGCNNDTIRNVNLFAGSNTVATTGIRVQGDNHNNLALIGNSIKKAQNGIVVVSTTTPAGLHSGLVIVENTIGDAVTANTIAKIGINLSNAPGSIITKNVIYNINESSTGSNYGILIASNASNSIISQNKIDTVKNEISSGYGAIGIGVTGSDTLSIVNNIITRMVIYNYSTTSTATNPFGIRIGAGSGHKVYYNSVNLYGNSSSSGTAGTLSAALLVAGGSNLDVRNNIFANSYLGLTGSNNYAIYSTVATPFAQIDYNNYYFSGTYGKLGYLTSNRLTIADWRTATTKDANSVSANPQFTSNADLTINSGSTPIALESGGTVIAGFNTDFNGDIRPKTIPTTYAGNLAPDMGALEFDGAPLDANPPVIQYTVLPPAGSANRNFSVSISDIGITATGVNINPGTSPRVYYKKTSDQNVFGGNTSSDNGWKWVEASNTVSPFDFLIDHTKINGGSVSDHDTIQYFVVAQDNTSPTANISALQSAGFVGTSVSSITTAPTNPNYYIISNLPPLAGHYNVGVGQPYITLTSAMNDLYLRGASDSVIFTLMDPAYSTSETFPIQMRAYIGASSINTVTIRPAIGVSAEITGSASAQAVIKFTDARYYTIDGLNTGGSGITITSANTGTSSVIWLTSTGIGSKHIRIMNTTINGGSNSATTAGIAATLDGSSSAAGADNDSILISGNTIHKCFYGIYANGTAAVSAGGLDAWRISDNLIGPAVSGTDNIGFAGIYMNNALNINISRDSIRNISTATATNGYAGAGILLTNVNRAVIHQNTLRGISSSTATSGTNSISAINLSTNVINSRVSRNTIRGIVSTTTAGYGAKALIVNTANSANDTLINNMISDVSCFVDVSSIYWPVGIDIEGASGSIKVYNNTVNIFGTYPGWASATGSTGAAALFISSTGTNNEILNNILVCSYDNPNVTVDKSFAFYSSAPISSFSNINHNNYYVSGTAATLAYFGADKPSLSALQTTTGMDAASINDSTNFISAVDLHITGTTLGNYAYTGQSLVSLTEDIDGDARVFLHPYIGADENTSNPLPVKLTSFEASVINAKDVLTTWTTASEINNYGFEVERSTDGKSFEKAGFVKGAGNSSRKLNYNFVDGSAFEKSNSSVLYYRLKQRDFDHKFVYSNIVRVSRNAAEANALSIFPNPYSTDYSISFTAASNGNASVEMMDIQGRMVASQQADIISGANTLSMLETATLKPGIYFVRITVNGESQILKLVKN